MARRFDRIRRDRQFSVTDTLPYITPSEDLPVELASLEVQVVVTGLLAETTQTLRLHNPNPRDLEGELCFPLPEGAAVCGYALDVDGKLVDGVVVPKQEARRILEAEIRKGVDPGLVEHVQGNVYRTRIYPLPAGGTRTVKIVYVSDLTVDGDDAAYHLPLGHAEGVDDVRLRVEVSQSPVEPVVLGGLGNMSLDHFDRRWVAEAVLGRGTPTEDLQVRLPGLPDQVTSVERFGDRDFFCVSSRIPTDSAAEPWRPRRLALLWDASGSRQDVSRDLALVEALVARWSEVTLDVRVLRDVLEPEVHTFDVSGGDGAALLAFLQAIPRDGATHLAGVDFGDRPHPDDEAWLVFSDGLGTVGTGLPAGETPRVFAITGQPHSDGALLAHLAQRSGGLHVNLLQTDPEAAAERLLSAHDALRVEGLSGCADVHVSVDRGRFTVLGRLTEETGRLQLAGPGAPEAPLTVTHESADPGRNVARAWAGKQAQLEKLTGGDPDTLVSLGRTYGLVTPGTSLLVLETLEQYLEYDIEPPETSPRLRKRFLERRRKAKRSEKEAEQAHLQEVLEMWRERVAWWETRFEPRPRPKHRGGGEPGPGVPEELREPDPAEPASLAERYVRTSASLSEGPPLGLQECAVPSGACLGAADGLEEELPSRNAQASIQIQPWSPDTPYLKKMKSAAAEDAYSRYLAERAAYAASPAFFLDCGDFLLEAGQRPLGLRVLSNLLEMALDDPALLRMYAWRMQQAGELDPAIAVLERVRALRDDEPQSHRDLALALEERWRKEGDEADATRAMELLNTVVMRPWHRFPEIEIIALMELNRLIEASNAAGIAIPDAVDPRLVKLLDLDVRISMSWDADLTDVDLHVFEPTGEQAYYGHNLTEIGGLVSHDFTEGYGPEEYVLRRAVPGDYTVKAHYYGSHQQTLSGPCTVVVTVFTSYGRPDEKKQVLTLRLDEAGEDVVVGTIHIGDTGRGKPDTDWPRKFRSLKKDMTLDEVTAIVGQPSRLEGKDETLLVYEPEPGVAIHVRAAPRVVAVQQLMDGATLDLV